MAKRRHYRTNRSFDRRPGRRPPRKCVLIVCEGRKTEPQYFRGLCRKLRLNSAEVRICGEECGNAPVSVVDFALQEKKQRKRRARLLEQRQRYDDADPVSNPSTQVHYLAEFLHGMAGLGGISVEEGGNE